MPDFVQMPQLSDTMTEGTVVKWLVKVGDKNLIKSFVSRKIPPPRRSTPPQACLESHNTLVAYMKSQRTQCNAGTIPFISITTEHGGELLEYKVSCPDYKFIEASGRPVFYPGGVGGDVLGATWNSYFINMWGAKHWSSIRAPGIHTVYGEEYRWSGGSSLGSFTQPGTGGVVAGYDSSDEHCFNDTAAGPDNYYIPNLYCGNSATKTKGVNIIHCCPQAEDKITGGWGSGVWATGNYKHCNSLHGQSPNVYIPFTVDHVIFN